MNKIIAIIVLFIALFVCFLYWIDTRVYTSERCMHLAMTTAKLVRKTPLGCCGWLIAGNSRMSEHWFNCGQYQIGDVIDWEYTNYSCKHLVEHLTTN